MPLIATSAYRDMVRQVLRHVDLESPGLKWRHHGLGMLQAELSDELRIHVWHPMLVAIPSGLRQVHDHRFTITSYVAWGTIIDIPYSVITKGDDIDIGRDAIATELHEIIHAKEQEKILSKGCSTATLTKSLGPAWVEAMPSKRYTNGDVYTIKRRDFHTTKVMGLAITLIHRSDFDDRLARILGEADVVGTAIVKDDSDKAERARKDILLAANIALRNTLR